jgi:hypothetical protein
LTYHSNRITDVANEVVDEVHAALVAALFRNARSAAEFHTCLVSGILTVHAA